MAAGFPSWSAFVQTAGVAGLLSRMPPVTLARRAGRLVVVSAPATEADTTRRREIATRLSALRDEPGWSSLTPLGGVHVRGTELRAAVARPQTGEPR
jgi:hypothetical protein